MNAPPRDTIERWAWDYLVTTDLSHKLSPPPLPRSFAEDAPPTRVHRPGRPPELVARGDKFKTPGREALRSPRRRAQLLHTFLHHELQAAELMCWAILAFPQTPRAFRTGLGAIAEDEARHMRLYAEHLAVLGHRYGDFPVRDWFWERVPRAASESQFVATMGMGFEGGNLDHTRRFADRLRAIGDEAGAALEEQIALEEIPHVRFAIHWFRAFTDQRWGFSSPQTPASGDRDDFASWSAHLPPPLSPQLMRGAPLDRAARLRAGFPEAFVDELSRWSEPGS